MKLSDITIRDPFVLPLKASQTYWLFGSTDKNVWNGPGTGFDCYHSRDLQNWEGPIPAFRPRPDFGASTQFWSPEVHEFNGRYFMFASFKADAGYRGTRILVADQPQGPYEPWSKGAVTPPHWECLDGTLHIDAEGNPWIVFCQEWVQVHNGAIWALRLSNDLKQAAGTPVFLFNATDAPWVRGNIPVNEKKVLKGYEFSRERFPEYVTDGPYLHRTKDGTLLMLWSSSGAKGYAMGIGRSESGTISGPWRQEAEPIWSEDGGHGMIFRTFDGRLMLTLHQPNNSPHERAIFRELEEKGDSIRLK